MTPTDHPPHNRPTRFEAQCDAVNLIFSSKTNANAESSVGLMSMGGAQPEVLTTLTTDFGRIVEGLHRTKIRGKSHLSTALNVGAVSIPAKHLQALLTAAQQDTRKLFTVLTNANQLALKHRQNKSQHQRIIVFTCSPLVESSQDLTKLARRLKKNAIAVDVVSFGELDPDTTAKMEAFHENIKQPAGSDADDQSELCVVPPGPNLLSDSLLSTGIMAGSGMGRGPAGEGADGDVGGSGGGGGGDGFEFGVDPNADPELALALRMSMEEDERRRQREERESQAQEGTEKLETVPEAEDQGEGSGGGSKGEGEDRKDGEGGSGSADKMDTS